MEDYIVQVNVTTKTYTDLIQLIIVGGDDDDDNDDGNNNLETGRSTTPPPVLVILDTKGSDCDIVQSIAKNSPYLPKFFIFENQQCRPKIEKTYTHLADMGYNWMEEVDTTFVFSNKQSLAAGNSFVVPNRTSSESRGTPFVNLDSTTFSSNLYPPGKSPTKNLNTQSHRLNNSRQKSVFGGQQVVVANSQSYRHIKNDDGIKSINSNQSNSKESNKDDYDIRLDNGRERPPQSETWLQPPFPRWGDEEGIDFAAIQAYSALNSQYPDSGKNLLRRDDGEFPVPNLLYVFGGMNRSKNDSTAQNRTVDMVTTSEKQPPTTPQVWVASRPRHAIKYWFLKKCRYAPMEVLLMDALHHLLPKSHRQGDKQNDETKWPRLTHEVQTTGIPMFIHLSDYRDCSKYNLGNYTVPIFTLCAAYHVHNCNFSLPLPSYATIGDVNHKSPQAWDLSFEQQDQSYPWSKKIRKVVWRGSGTGSVGITDKLLRQVIPREDWLWPIRKHMVYEATNDDINKKQASSSPSSSQLDVGFTNNQIEYRNNTRLAKAAKMPFEDFQNYVGVLDVDGNSWSSRFASLLAMNSVVLKVEPEFADYFMPGSSGLKPWVHYVPIRMDSGDLHEIVEYVLDPANELEMRSIIQNAHSWVRTNLLYEKLLVDTLNTLEFYVENLDKGNSRGTKSWTKAFEEMKEENLFVNNNQFKALPYKESVDLHAFFHNYSLRLDG